MSAPLHHQKRHLTYLLWLQFGIVVLVSLLFVGLDGLRAGGSAFLGGMAWFVPSLYFIHKLFFKKRSFKPAKIIKDFYLGELIKLILSGTILALSFKYLPILPLPLITGYITAIAVLSLAPIFWCQTL